MPLAFASLRADVDSLVTCSDASNSGGGACASTGLTERGINVVNNTQVDSFFNTNSSTWPETNPATKPLHASAEQVC
jgi:hypothetical protein